MIRKTIILLLLVLPVFLVYGQKELVIYKGAKMRRTVLPAEEAYVFKTKQGVKISGEITQLLDSAIIINQDTLFLKDIAKIYTPFPKRGQLFFGELLFKGGIFLTIIDPLNNLINNDKPYLKRPGIIGLAAIPVGYVIMRISLKSYKIKGRTHLRIVQFD
tara:strand:+ start:55800 stop:56279 length:480 start_codon:yes stop_codon:yes gene_type:complete